MKTKIRNILIQLAKEKRLITYTQLASDVQIPYSGIAERDKLHELLGEISTEEVNAGRPMLSVLVHRKNDVLRKPGTGFFKLADELGQKLPKEKDLDFQFRMINKCFKYWEKR